MAENSTIRVSIIMGIYNCAKTLPKSIDSLLEQTFQDWDLIMCDDGSGDDTWSVAQNYADQFPQKIKLVRNEKNMGLNYTLNHCAKYATGEYIARQDGDDESLPTRLEKEVAFLDAHPEFAIVSCGMIHVDENGEWGKNILKEYPTKKDFMKGNPFSHPGSMFHRKTFEAVGGYSVSPKLIRVEDYHLWTKMYAAGYRGCNIQEPLYRFTDDRNAYRRRNLRARWNAVYARNCAISMLNLPWYYRFSTIQALLKWCIPVFVYDLIHRNHLQPTNNID